MRISIIAALARNGVIGVNNKLPWHIKGELQYFKSLTMGHHIIMGRKTYESIGRPLPGRTSVIVTRNPDYRVPGCLVVHSIQEALGAAATDDEVFVIGGAELIAQALGIADRLYLTEIQADFEGDTYFPRYDHSDWREIRREENFDEDGGFTYYYVVYDRAEPSTK